MESVAMLEPAPEVSLACEAVSCDDLEIHGEGNPAPSVTLRQAVKCRVQTWRPPS